MRIVFAGTRDIAIPALRLLLEGAADRWQLVGVFTQPDRPAGRSKEPVPPPVKVIAENAGLPVFQPESLRDDAALAALRSLAPDVGVVAGYAQLLPRRALRVPSAGWLNIHPSLLPRHRGPSPVAAAILAGDAETGVSLIKLASAMDAGPIVDQTRAPIEANDTAASLTARLGNLGAERLVAVLEDWVGRRITEQPQDDAAATYSRLLSRQDGLLDWTLTAIELDRRVRAFDPWPGTFTFLNGKRLALRHATALAGRQSASPGLILRLDDVTGVPALLVATGDGLLAVRRLQLEGRKEQDAAQFLRGQPGLLGSRLGT